MKALRWKRSGLASNISWARCHLLCALALGLILPVPSEASTQCPPSNEDPAVRIERVDSSAVSPSALAGKPEPVAVFRITGTRSLRVLRLGFESWSKGQAAPEEPRRGFGADCGSFEHYILLSTREVYSKGSNKLLVGYWYHFPSGRTSEGETVTLRFSSPSPPRFWVLENAATLPAEADLPIWAVFLGATPKSGEAIPETAAKAGQALVLRARNSNY